MRRELTTSHTATSKGTYGARHLPQSCTVPIKSGGREIKKKLLGFGIALSIMGVTAVPAFAQTVSGKGTSLCHAVPAVDNTFPAGGPGYNFQQAPPASDTAVV